MLKQKNLAQAIFAEKFTLQVSPERDETRLRDLRKQNKMLSGVFSLKRDESIFAQARVFSLRRKLGVLSGLFSLKRLLSSLGEMDFHSGKFFSPKLKKNCFVFLFFSSYFFFPSFIYLSCIKYFMIWNIYFFYL